MKISFFFLLTGVFFFFSACRYNMVYDYKETARHVDSIAVLPTVFSLYERGEKSKKTENDLFICENLDRSVNSSIHQLLGKKYVIGQSAGFRLVSDSCRSALIKDMVRARKEYILPDYFALNPLVLEGTDSIKHPYLLINFIEGSYKTMEQIQARNMLLVPIAAASYIFTGTTMLLFGKDSRILFHSILYDRSNQRMLYYHWSDEYIDGIYDLKYFEPFAKAQFKKLYYRKKVIKPA